MPSVNQSVNTTTTAISVPLMNQQAVKQLVSTTTTAMSVPLMNRRAVGGLSSASVRQLADVETIASTCMSRVPAPRHFSHLPASSPTPPYTQHTDTRFKHTS